MSTKRNMGDNVPSTIPCKAPTTSNQAPMPPSKTYEPGNTMDGAPKDIGKITGRVMGDDYNTTMNK